MPFFKVGYDSGKVIHPWRVGFIIKNFMGTFHNGYSSPLTVRTIRESFSVLLHENLVRVLEVNLKYVYSLTRLHHSEVCPSHLSPHLTYRNSLK